MPDADIKKADKDPRLRRQCYICGCMVCGGYASFGADYEKHPKYFSAAKTPVLDNEGTR